MIGEKAGWLAPGFLEAGARDDQLILLKEQESARSLVEEFQGAIMLKGSRVNKLEQLLPHGQLIRLRKGPTQMLSYLQYWESFFGPFRLFQFISVRAI